MQEHNTNTAAEQTSAHCEPDFGSPRNPDYTPSLQSCLETGKVFGNDYERPEIAPQEFFRSELSQRLLINADSFCRWAAYLGWRRHPGNGMYVKITGRILTQATRGDLMRDISDVLVMENSEFIHTLMKDILKLTTASALELLPELNVPVLQDDKDNQYWLYNNGILRINSAGYELIPWESSNPHCELSIKNDESSGEQPETLRQISPEGVYFWRHKVIARNFVKQAPELWGTHPWFRFLEKLCTKPREIPRADDIESRVEKFLDDRFSALKATLGKMTHTYNNPSNPVAVILTDDCGFSDENSGGSGKSLLTEAVLKIRQGIVLQCRHITKNDSFLFDSVTGDIDALVFDDLDASKLPFDVLYAYLTNGLVVNRKGEHHIKYSFEENPRFIITTNQALKGSDTSDLRRRWDMQIELFFNLVWKPRDLNNGKNFFTDWTDADWQYFDNIMADCAHYYFWSNAHNEGCPPYENNTLERSVREEIGNELPDWMDHYLQERNSPVIVDLTSFRNQLNEETGLNEYKKLPRKLAKYCRMRNITLTRYTQKLNGKSTNMLKFDWLPF